MAYRASNAAYAYDMYEAQPVSYPNRTAAPAPVAPERPRLDVVSGEGLEANQAVSPYFTHVMKLAFVFVALFCVVGFARIALAGATTALLNNNAQAATSLEQAHQEKLELAGHALRLRFRNTHSRSCYRNTWYGECWGRRHYHARFFGRSDGGCRIGCCFCGTGACCRITVIGCCSQKL